MLHMGMTSISEGCLVVVRTYVRACVRVYLALVAERSGD